MAAIENTRKDREEARDVRGDLPGVFATEIATEARLPDLPGAPDQVILRIVVSCVR